MGCSLHTCRNKVHVLVLCMVRDDFPPGDPGNAVSGFAKVLLGRETHRQKTRADSICREGRREGALFKNKTQMWRCLLFNSWNSLQLCTPSFLTSQKITISKGTTLLANKAWMTPFPPSSMRRGEQASSSEGSRARLQENQDVDKCLVFIPSHKKLNPCIYSWSTSSAA